MGRWWTTKQLFFGGGLSTDGYKLGCISGDLYIISVCTCEVAWQNQAELGIGQN